jgi:PPOX class probable F420-dependent enzyme
LESSDPAKQFTGRQYINLESYTRKGEPKLTPVQSIEDGGLIYLRTGSRTWKVKRIRRNPRVRIVRCNRSGAPLGAWVGGEAHVVEGEECERLKKLFRKEYGAVGNLLVGLVARLRGERLTTVISIRLQS